MPKLAFQWNSVPNLILSVKVHRLVPKLFRADVTRAEHRLPRFFSGKYSSNEYKVFNISRNNSNKDPHSPYISCAEVPSGNGPAPTTQTTTTTKSFTQGQAVNWSQIKVDF